MENLNVIALRDLAREAMLASGARGFMRFAKEGEALLVTDTALRCADGGAALEAALKAAGFACRREGTLLRLTPEDTLLARLCAREGPAPQVRWESPLNPAQALAARLSREADMPLTDAGRALVLEMARLCWQPQDKVLAGLGVIRAMAAQRLRQGDRTGFAMAGRLLANWCQEQMKGDDAR